MSALRILTVALTAAVLAIAGCANNSTGAEPGATTPAAAPIVVDRTGGNVGVNDHVVLQPDGSWTATDKSGTSKSGKLTSQQTAAVYQIAGSEAFAAEAAAAASPGRCMDAPTVTITYGDRKVSFMDCGTPDTPAKASALLQLIQQQVFQ